jgi:transcriptional regulator with XRE-family HTH domain/catechol 2,3-dioxygenase-like lactoylglutathione lyase family enzyme
MNPIEILQRDIEQALPSTWTRLRRPRNPNGMWWLDAKQNDHVVTVQWSPRRRFGISASAIPDGYGEGPEETYEDQESATARVLKLLRTKAPTVPPHDVVLRELRALLGVTQEQLAERLGVQQAAVSRLERREDITLSSLRRYVAALGGELEINVRTAAGHTVRLSEPGEPQRHRAACDHVESGFPLSAPPHLLLPFTECETWLKHCDALVRSRWPVSASTLALQARSDQSLAKSDPCEGGVALDPLKAWQLSKAIVYKSWTTTSQDTSATDRFRSVLRHLVAHEIGHFVDRNALCAGLPYRQFTHPELQADVVAGWLAAQSDEDAGFGAAVSSLLGCRHRGCTHPPPEARSFAYLTGHIEGTRERRSPPQVTLLVIRVTDLERSRAFYEHLGLSLRPERHGDGPLHYSCSMLGTVFELYPCTSRAVPGSIRLGLQLPSIHNAIQELLSAGMLSERPQFVERSPGPNVCVVRDPDGNAVELVLGAALR